MTDRYERWITWGLLVLVAVMPVHAFLSVWLGHLTGHQVFIQAWKEVLLAAMAMMASALCCREPSGLERLRQPWGGLGGLFALVALLVTIATRPPLAAIAFGLKT